MKRIKSAKVNVRVALHCGGGGGSSFRCKSNHVHRLVTLPLFVTLFWSKSNFLCSWFTSWLVGFILGLHFGCQDFLKDFTSRASLLSSVPSAFIPVLGCLMLISLQVIRVWGCSGVSRHSGAHINVTSFRFSWKVDTQHPQRNQI